MPVLTWNQALRKLSQPVPAKYIKQKPDKSRADYVPHHIIRQFLHGIFDDHRFETVDVREYEVHKTSRDGKDYTERHVAIDVALHVRIGDEWRTYRGWGESENSNAPYKSAESDAVKRIAAMHLGLGLHLWSREHYFLPKALEQDVSEAAEEAAQRDATYGGDGDEATADDPAPPTETAADEDVPPMSPDERAALRGRFFGILNNLDLPYETMVRPWMEAHYGATMSTIGPKELRALVATLDPADDSKQTGNRRRFKVAVTEWAETNLAETPSA